MPALTKVHEVYGKLEKMKECYWIFPTFSSNGLPINQHSEAHSNLGNFLLFPNAQRLHRFEKNGDFVSNLVYEN